MAKKRSSTGSAALPAQGTKISFDDYEEADFAAPAAAPVAAPAVDDDSDSDSDSDSDAPEAVGISSGREEEKARLAAEEDERRAAKASAKLRAQKVAEAKAAAAKSKEVSKRKRPDSDAGDRAARRMAAAMEDGEDESGSDEFHTGSEGEDDDESQDEDGDSDDDEDGDSDDSETLNEGPLSANEIRMRAQMDAMMAAMEQRALGHKATAADIEGPGKERARKKNPKESKAAPAPVPAPASDDETAFDLTPGVAPLSAATLAAAEAEITTTPTPASSEPKAKKSQRRRKKARTEQVSRKISDDTTLHLLPPVLSIGSDLPPVVAPRQAVAKANASRNMFMKRAMRDSGKIPGRSKLDGRKK